MEQKEEEDWKKEEAEKEAYEKALLNAWKMQLKVSPQIFLGIDPDLDIKESKGGV